MSKFEFLVARIESAINEVREIDGAIAMLPSDSSVLRYLISGRNLHYSFIEGMFKEIGELPEQRNVDQDMQIVELSQSVSQLFPAV